MTTNSKGQFYTNPDEFLQQGDIFRIDIVAPIADTQTRIFRSIDGRHGSVVFEENCEGKIFEKDELKALLGNSPLTDLHTQPFWRTSDGQEEMVVVYAQLFQYFIIATQTCDVSGRDKKPLPWTTILPVKTLSSECKSCLLPLYQNRLISIHDFVTKNYESSIELRNATDTDYPEVLRGMIEEWKEKENNKELKKSVAQVMNFLSDYSKPMVLYSLPRYEVLSIPESFIDFASPFTVIREKLLEIKANRLARICSPQREDFSHKFGVFYSRVAIPQ